MRKILAGLLSILGLSQAGAQAPAPAPESVTGDLRAMVLQLVPGDIGITAENFPQNVWGVVMETGMDTGYYTLVVLADDTTSLYFSNGGGIIGAGEHAKVRESSHQFIDRGNQFESFSMPVTSMDPPGIGFTNFFFLTFDGLRTYTAKEVELGEDRDSLAPLFHAGHAVIASARKAQP